jgi:hypothetical protein
MRRPRKPAGPENSLLGDLESIRALLESGQPKKGAPRTAEPEQGSDVPMLDDVVEGALRVDESPLSGRDFDRDAQGPSGLADEAIKALMGDEWRESADRIISAAHRSMRDASSRWSDAQTDTLAATLRRRIDGVLEDWVNEIALANLDSLRRRVLEAIEDEIRAIGERLKTGDD